MQLSNLFCIMNRKGTRKRESCANDVSKLLEFFLFPKNRTLSFFCDFQLDAEGKIKSIFGHMLACTQNMLILVML
jgi:hypothetical protein